MKIKKLEVVGFKSFVDKTVLHFDHDVTGIVGPNGCGKSNVVDAIKWVMGEQSPARLRGKSMDDVIFNGSESRGPHGFAEVSITFDNSDGLAPPEYRDYAEITVTRRLDRSGRSDYMINRTPVRLMDVTNLFLGTGVGRRAYSIIEQGRIGFIVSSKPADRRTMIEEAAGITKFKVRKRAAERKMEQTRANLLRVGDILQELERSLASLKRQAQKAERYKLYRDEVRDLELYVASFRYLELFNETRVVRSALQTASAAAEGSRLALRVREAEIEGERVHVQTLGSGVEGAQNDAYELDNAVRVLEGQVQSLLERLESLREREQLAERELTALVGQRDALRQERDALAAALEDLEAAEAQTAELLTKESAELERRRLAVADAERAVSTARGRVADADRRLARAEAVLTSFEQRRAEGRERLEKLRVQHEGLLQRLQGLEEEREALLTRLTVLQSGKDEKAKTKEEIEAELAELREEMRDSDANLESLRHEAAEKRSRLSSLREVAQRFEGVGAGVRALMTRFGGEGLVGLVADRVRCPAELDGALAAALGDLLQGVVVEDEASALAAMRFLRDEEAGRATLVPRTLSVPGPTCLHADLSADAGVVGRLVDLVQGSDEDVAFLRRLVGDTIVVRDLDTALRLRHAGCQNVLVTLAGERIGDDGLFTGGAGDEGSTHLLELKREARQLESVVVDLDARLEAAVRRHGELRQGIAQRQAAIDAARTATHDAEIAIVKAEKDIRKAEGDAATVREAIARLTAEIEELAAALDRASDEEAEARSEIEAARGAVDEAKQELNAAEAIFAERQRSVEEQGARVTEVRVRAAQARERAESDRGALERLSRSIEALDQREERLRGDVTEGARQQGVLAAQLLVAREQIGEAITRAMEAHERLGEVRARYEEARHALGVAETDLRGLRTRIEEVSARVTELTLRDRELSMELEHLIEQIGERHRVDIRHVLDQYHNRSLPDEQVRQRVKELLRLIERMGAINLTAIEEYEEKSVRYEQLKAQSDDLNEALRKLEKAIREMNRESRRMFKEAFVAVNERFKRIFPQLFRGGKAELALTDPGDLLESGIDIRAQPPGKKLGSLELMSGGEKALTAVALIFAIFQYKPSPFCLLDEVDAPLDEANISRFAQAISQMTDRSQFIVITHSKRTMEFADVLYGVTMEQPGVSKVVSVELKGDENTKQGDDANDSAVAVA